MDLRRNAEALQKSFADDDLVITGISGRFPLADNMEEFKENLMNKKNCIVQADQRWLPNKQGFAGNYVGTVKSLDKFDNEFFNTSVTMANIDDPQKRILSEVCYEAIVDSGYDPMELSGKQVGAFVGLSDSETTVIERMYENSYFDRTSAGYIACMMSNKLSHRYNFTGPSFTVDATCSSGAIALEDAFQRLKDGRIEAALVGGSSLCVDPRNYKLFLDTGMLSPTGKMHSYDANANGFVKGDGVVAIFVQKKKDARRIYAKIHNIVSTVADYEPECKDKGILIPSLNSQLNLYKKAYEDADIDPSVIDYVEGHGLSIPLSDQIEVDGIDEMFCKCRTEPLLLGSVKSCIGHTGATSALCSIAKVILSFEAGLIVPSINYETPNPKCPSLTNGKIKVVTEVTPYDKPLIAVSSFGYSGLLVHMILERSTVRKNTKNETEGCRIPELIVYSATTSEALDDMFSYFQENLMPREFFALLNKSAYSTGMLSPYRGFTLLRKDEAPITSITHCTPVKRQIWYVITGMGCQWHGMGLELMQLDIFAESMKRSSRFLKSFGIDLIELLNTKEYLLTEKHITSTFVTDIAIQIALVDVLRALGLEPDGIIGHGTGELVCSYADGCSTAEQTILAAYYIGSSLESNGLPHGAMATVGITWEEAKRRCPEGVFPACHNVEDSVIISGFKEAVERFIKQLKSENIFTRFVNAYGCGFHCETISAAVERIRSSLQMVYAEPKQRSKRWLSTSYCEHEWKKPESQMCDANYVCHNIESEVHFSEVLSHIPEDAVIIEISPQSLLQSSLQRAVGSKTSTIGLMEKSDRSIDFFLSAVGKLYILGLDPQVESLYDPVSYPVPRGTPMIGPLIHWDHSKSFFVPKYLPWVGGKSTFVAKVESEDRFLLDHRIDGRSLYPATGYMYLAWRALGEALKMSMKTVPVLIENFRIMRATILNPTVSKSFDVSLLNVNGDFEIVDSGSIVATGKISTPKQPMFESMKRQHKYIASSLTVSGPELYNELKIHGYEYGPAFQGLLEINIEGSNGLVKWNDEWISFLDSLLLFFGIIYQSDDFRLPTGALSVKIDPIVHKEFLASMEETGLKGIPVVYDGTVGKCCTPGVEIRSLKLEPAPHRSLAEIVPILEEYAFVPYFDKSAMGSEETQKCESYIQECCHVARQIVKSLNINGKIQNALQDAKYNPTVEVQDRSTTAEDDCFLLKTLQNVREMSFSRKLAFKIEEQCENISVILSEDMLFKSILSERPLRILLDVAVENSSGKMSVTEWHHNSPMLLTEVQKMMKHFIQTRTNFTLVHSQATTVDAEDLEQRSIVVVQAFGNDDIPTNYKESSDLGMTSFMLGNLENLESCIRKVISLTREEGFVLFFHKHELTAPESVLHFLSKVPFTTQSEAKIEKLFLENHLLVISKMSIPYGINVYLLRKAAVKTDPVDIRVVKVLDTEYGSWVEDLKKAMVVTQERDSSSTLYLVAQDSVYNGIIGMVNCLKQEPGGNKIRCVLTDDRVPPFSLNESFYEDVLKKNLVMNVYMNGCWGTFRHISLPSTTPQKLTECAYVECSKLGDLSSFKWLETPVEFIQSHEESYDELYHVYYSALNFKDVMLATGKLSVGVTKQSRCRTDIFPLGLEFSGRDKNGRRTMGMAMGGAVCNTLIRRPVMLLDVPDNWTLEEAATVLVVYATCYYALIIRGELEHGEKILIHSGTGGIGQAAIIIALSIGCEIFTTVGTQEKRDFLLETFPLLKPENIGSSRDTTFEDMVMRQTNGEGVDVVLNSLADDKFQASVRCLGYHGRFLEIGKYDLHLNNSLGLEIFLKGISFYGVQLDTHFERNQKSIEVFEAIETLLYDGIRKGVVQPLNTTVFSIDDTENAFRYMGSGKHIGKVLLKVREEEPEKILVPAPMKVNACSTLWFSKNKSYIIIGGLGGFGIELAKWLVNKGAGTVILTSRYGVRTSYHNLCLKRWAEAGDRVVVSTLNVTKRDEAQKLLEEAASTYGSIGGIFNSAVVLKDAFIENQSPADFEEVCAPKALATKYLDELTRKMCPDLDMFVCFSSISCGKGNAGQTNYGYANSVMERICEQRKRDGLPGLAIQWGIIGDVGLVHRRMGDDAMIAGVMAQKIRSCIQCLEKFILQDKPVVSSFVTADESRLKKKPDDVLGLMARMFGMADINEMNPYRTFGEMGIDSMNGVEMKQLLETSLDAQLSLQEIQDLKLDDVKKLIAENEKNRSPLADQEKEIKSIKLNAPCPQFPTDAVVFLNSSKNGIPLFIVHGNDFLNKELRKLCGGMSRPVIALQSTKETPLNTLQDMSLWYLEQIQKACSGTSIHLAGISTAANLALEIALQLKHHEAKRPEIKSLTILDGSLDLMAACTNTEDDKKKNASIYEASDLCEFLSLFSDSDLSQLRTQLELLPTIESKLSMISSLLISSDKSAFEEAAKLYTKKQNLMRFRVPNGKLPLDLTAIEASEKVLPNDVSSVKTCLSQICSGKITIHRVSGKEGFLVEDISAAKVSELLDKM